MTRLTAAFATTLTALTASKADRLISGLLLPFGEEGRTNLGTLTAAANSLTLPDDPGEVILNVEHDQTRPIGKATSLAATAEGIRASFRVAQTRAGDDALTEASEGIRACLSVEVEGPVIRSGKLIAGSITGAALVAVPAFPGAKLAAAADLGELDDEINDPTDDETNDPTDDETNDPTDDETNDKEDPEMKKPMNAARIPSTGAPRLTASKTDKNTLFGMLASAASGDRTMLAALSDVVPANILGIEQPQYVGELWDGKAYERQFIPAWNHADLNSYEVTGWRWKTRPQVAAYSGNKTDVPSNGIETEQVKITAERIAGAHDIDRKFRDFNDVEFFNAYFAAMTESYAKVSDALALAKVTAAATAVTMGTQPNGIAKGLVQLVDGILAVLNETDTIPDTAFMATDLYRDVILTRNDDILGYLDAALGFEDGTMRGFRIKPTSQISAGKTLVTCHDAVTVHELGGTPIRVEALDIARGGLDEGVFGYLAVNTHDKGGIALVSAGA